MSVTVADEPEALARLREELTGKAGNPEWSEEHAEATITNNISNSTQDDLFTPATKPQRERNTQHGTRKDYTLARLKKDAPALFDEVKAGRSDGSRPSRSS